MKNVTVGWFEIPVKDMDRAILFYEKVFECKLEKQVMGDFQMAWFPWEDNDIGAGGSLVYHEQFYATSEKAGPLIYFNSEDCSVELKRVEEAGGKVQIEKRMIAPDIGFMGVFIDSEGNRIALYSRK
ncbi:VOC family protein [Algoriphagus halophytocola]|uniref:VOC family protein n=1 Tax=Algoriphagus halophytocola TaxID=2991499 RepID=A0ABY6MGR3_9BACT|nr:MULTISPECIES: VOC family protein [unclassified Algoriphagus]UZD22654.1 VOC family protein [Algoriphagus sp. TR-M5]WBL43919.1 VOC family protein [Algoriphagus sp. TR-M9]